MMLALLVSCACMRLFSASDAAGTARQQAAHWRQEHRIIDLYQHIDFTTQHLARDVRTTDAAGIGLAVNLSGGTATRGPGGEASEFELNTKLADALFSGRFVEYMNLDYSGWDRPDFAARR